MGVIYIATDYGWKDPYVALLKNRIYTLNKKSEVIDITHELLPFNIEFASWALYLTFLHTWEPAIYCWVVDPGVGTSRKSLIAKYKKSFFVVPDNGLLTPFILKYQKMEFYEILPFNLKEMYLKLIYKKRKKRIDYQIFSTFHGRDIFAPASALLSLKPDLLRHFTIPLKSVTRLTSISFSEKIDDDTIKGKVIYIDHFGNLITNIEIPTNWKRKKIVLNIYYKQNLYQSIHGLSNTFGDKPKDEILFFIGSFGYLELAKNQENLNRYFELQLGNNYYQNMEIILKSM